MILCANIVHAIRQAFFKHRVIFQGNSCKTFDEKIGIEESFFSKYSCFPLLITILLTFYTHTHIFLSLSSGVHKADTLRLQCQKTLVFYTTLYIYFSICQIQSQFYPMFQMITPVKKSRSYVEVTCSYLLTLSFHILEIPNSNFNNFIHVVIINIVRD